MQPNDFLSYLINNHPQYLANVDFSSDVYTSCEQIRKNIGFRTVADNESAIQVFDEMVEFLENGQNQH